jgi:thioredoxin 1
MRTLAFLLLAGLAQADIITHTGGAPVKGRLTGIEAGQFLIADSSNTVVKLPAATVTGVDFNGHAVPATFATHAGQLDGKVWLFARGAFHLDNTAGETRRIPAATIVRANFGAPAPVEAQPAAPKPAPVAVPKSQLIARAERVDLAKHLPAGKVTVVDFFAEWCGPCRQLRPWLENYVAGDPDVVLRKVDIVGWQSPVAMQHQIRGVPHLQFYDRQGRKIGEMTGFNEAQFRDWIKKAKAS